MKKALAAAYAAGAISGAVGTAGALHTPAPDIEPAGLTIEALPPPPDLDASPLKVVCPTGARVATEADCP